MKKNIHVGARPLLEVKKLSLRFAKNDAPIISNINFNLYPKEFIGIIGESGSGKSVTAKCILQLNTPDGIVSKESEIKYGGKNLLTMTEEQIRKIRGREIAIVFQDPMVYLNPTMIIGLQIEESLRHHFPHYISTESYTKTVNLLKIVELSEPTEIYKKYPHELSGGMRQRVLIAIALAAKPRIFIADEITTALDASIKYEILILLKKLQQKLAMSVIFITHDLNIISNFSDRIIVMYKGEILEIGNSDQLYRFPKHPYTKALQTCIPSIHTNNREKLIPIKVIRDEKNVCCNYYNKCIYAVDKCKDIRPMEHDDDNHYVRCHFPMIEKIKRG